MKYFVVADIHGEYDLLVEYLEMAGFDRNNKNHCVISLGDMFDRGPDNVKVYEYLSGLPRKILLLGNHDEFFLEFLSGIYSHSAWHIKRNGMNRTIADFAGLDYYWTGDIDPMSLQRYNAIISNKFPKLLGFMKSLKHVVKIGDKIFTHAGFRQTQLGFVSYIHAETPKEIENMIRFGYGIDGEWKFFVGHWYCAMLDSYFGGDGDPSYPFEYKDFMGLDSMCNLNPFLHVYVFESDEEVKTYSVPMILGNVMLD